MSWAVYFGLIAFFTVVFTVFYCVACSVLLGIRDNYLRYYQKAELQWTTPGQKDGRTVVHLKWWVVVSMLTAWIVVQFVVQP